MKMYSFDYTNGRWTADVVDVTCTPDGSNLVLRHPFGGGTLVEMWDGMYVLKKDGLDLSRFAQLLRQDTEQLLDLFEEMKRLHPIRPT